MSYEEKARPLAQINTTGYTTLPAQWPQQTPFYTMPPTFCSGDVHVFPCPHCEQCKCGKATVKREKGTK